MNLIAHTIPFLARVQRVFLVVCLRLAIVLVYVHVTSSGMRRGLAHPNLSAL